MSLSGASQSSVTSRNIHNAIFSQASKAQNSRDFSNEAPCQQSYCVRAFAPKASTQGTNNLFMSYSTQRYDDILSSVATRIRGPRFSNCAGESLSLYLSLSLSALQIVPSDLPEKPKKLDKILVHSGSNFVHKERETEILSCLSKCMDSVSLHNEKLLTQRTKNKSAKK
jgi:hypothetical protein